MNIGINKLCLECERESNSQVDKCIQNGSIKLGKYATLYFCDKHYKELSLKRNENNEVVKTSKKKKKRNFSFHIPYNIFGSYFVKSDK